MTSDLDSAPAAVDPAIAEAAKLLERRPASMRGPATEAEIEAYLAAGGRISRLPPVVPAEVKLRPVGKGEAIDAFFRRNADAERKRDTRSISARTPRAGV